MTGPVDVMVHIPRPAAGVDTFTASGCLSPHWLVENLRPLSVPESSLRLRLFIPRLLGVVVLYYASYTLLGAISWDLSGNVFLGQLADQMAATGQDINDLPAGFTPQIMLLLFFLGGLTVFNVLPGVITGFGEEFGWRGLMFPLLYSIRPWMAFVIGGLVWFAWHVPLILVMPQSQSLSPTETAANVAILAVGSVCTFTFLAYVYIKSQSVFVAAVAHITLNNASRSFSYFVILENQLLANLSMVIVAASEKALQFTAGIFAFACPRAIMPRVASRGSS